MRRWPKKPLVGACIGVALLLGFLFLGVSINVWLRLPADLRDSWKRVQEGVTTEAEVEALVGPPVMTGTRLLTPEMARVRGLAEGPDGQAVTVTLNYWWYDEHHIMETEVDDRGVVIRCHGPQISPPRSPILRYWEFEAKPFLFESSGWRRILLMVPGAVVGIALLCLLAWLIRRAWRRKETRAREWGVERDSPFYGSGPTSSGFTRED
jgi:hypothetical protein